MTLRELLKRRFWVVYPLWFAVCAILFVTLRDVEDPSRPAGCIGTKEATQKALAALHKLDPQRFADYEIVNIAYAAPREMGSVARLILLADRPQRTALREAIVVELNAVTGEVVTIRRVPGMTSIFVPTTPPLGEAGDSAFGVAPRIPAADCV